MIFRRHLFHIFASTIVVILAGCTERPASAPQGGESAPAQNAQSAVSAVAAPAFSSASDAAAMLALPSSGTCSLENALNMSEGTPSPGAQPNSYAVNRTAPYKLIGFATNSEEGTVPTNIRALIHGPSGDFAIAGTTGLDREDVAKYFNKPGLSKSGYQIDASFAGVSPGAYEVFLVKGEGDGARLCPTHQTIVIE